MQRRIFDISPIKVDVEIGESSTKSVCKTPNCDKAKPCARCKIKETCEIYGIQRSGLLPFTSDILEVRSIEKMGRRSPHSNLVNDLRDELMRTKRVYAMAICENSLIRTKLKIAEKERRRREDEVEELLDTKNDVLLKHDASKYEDRVQLNLLRKKVLHYERALRESTEQNTQLMSDQGIAKIAVLRTRLNKLEDECVQLKKALLQSIPEAEHLKEKEQYMKVIDRITEENVQLRKIIDEYEKRRKEAEQTLEHVYSGAHLIKEFRKSGIASKKQADFYKNSLNLLVNNNRRLARVLLFKNRSNSESRVNSESGDKRRTSRANSSSNSLTNSKTNFLPAINPESTVDTAQKVQQLLKKPMAVVVATRGSAKSAFTNETILLKGSTFKRRKLGKMSFSLDNPEFGIAPRMYNSVSTNGDIEEEEVAALGDNTENANDTKDDSNSDGGKTLIKNRLRNLDDDYDDDPHLSSNSPEAIIYGNGAAIELRDAHSANSSSTFFISERLMMDDKRMTLSRPPHSSEDRIKSAHIHRHGTNDRNDHDTHGNKILHKKSGEYLENLNALKTEYYDEIEVTEEKAKREMQNIIRSVQSHILRVKMLGIREQTLLHHHGQFNLN